MTTKVSASDAETPRVSSDTIPGTTKALLSCGTIAGPLYVVVVLLQAVTRDGFDITRHPASLMSNGDLGWVQITNFLVSGLLFIAGAIGLRRVMPTGRGRTWGPVLISGLGAGMVAAGIFVADPVDGFPPGTPLGPPSAVSLHGMLHFVAGTVTFLSLIAACFVFARRFVALGQPGWAAYSATTGLIFFVSWAALMGSFGQVAAVNVAFAIAVALGTAGISVVTTRLSYR